MRSEIRVTGLVTRARNGDAQAWDALVERYAPLIWSICRRHRLEAADAADASQNVWLHLVDHLGNLRDPAALPGWLATTARRECGRVLRAARRTAATPGMRWAPRPSPMSRRPPRRRNCWRPSGTRRCARRSVIFPRTASG